MIDRRSERWEFVLLGAIGGLTALSAALVVAQGVSPIPMRGAGLVIDRLSASLSLLVASVGAITFRFSQRYLDGDPGRRAFLIRLAATVVAAYLLMLADHLVVLVGAWTCTSLGLHALLTHERGRAEALRPARKKFLISRLGDVALIGAMGVIGLVWGTLELSTFLERASSGGNDLAVGVVAILVAVAALTKSAQFPFHSWLPETMEAPTPVSALMHAGIINAGGALLLRFAPVIVQAPAALVMLTGVGTLTVVLGLLAMWSQVKIKRTLAWSTVAQMGFMMVQCGLAAFPAAWLHILGHGLYKAWSFLRSGELPGPMRPMGSSSPGRVLILATLGTLAAIPALMLANAVTTFDPMHSPGELALAAIVALAIGQLWVALLRNPGVTPGRVVGAIGGTIAVALLSFELYHLAGLFLAPVLGPLVLPTGPIAWVSAALPVAAMVALIVSQSLMPVLVNRSIGRAFYVHALNGFYFGAIADGLVDRVWSRLARSRRGVEGA
ncbi:proton-conducting transporter transmembrane domain-containing protein [Tautonia rosea]|uniref:proton-conducting transporter transmembrane domain-containing protein n=1 Tax=Tautonia rosea TaxID=2728037 RepID=UPI0014747844|nr:proton-conducting transporter membrane subunit [Tautonia rosea]